MAITANKTFWTEFIDIYHSLPCLWNTKDENYNNRESRSMAWNKLVEKLQEVEPDANQHSVKRKINTFRSNFNREVRKIRQTQMQQPSDVYNPTLWYFDHLSFLLNQEKYNSNGVSIDGHYDEEITLMGLTCTKSEIMEENETMHTEPINQEVTNNEKLINKSMTRLAVRRNNHDKLTVQVQTDETSLNQEPIVESQTSDPLENHLNHLDDPEEKSLKTTSNHKICRPNLNKRSRLRLKTQDPYNRAIVRKNMLSSILTDESAIYGQSWACCFRKLSPQQKLFAKKAIEEILILGQINALKFNTVPPVNTNLFEVASDEG